MMKRTYYTFLFLLFFTLIAHAQNLTVESFTPSTDVDASVHRVNDLNGQACALVKVMVTDEVTDAKGASVISQQGNRSFTKHGSNEYWVYLAKGARHLTVATQNHLPLKIVFKDYGITMLEGVTTYVLRLTKPLQVSDNITHVNISSATTSSDASQSFTVNGVTFKMIRVDGGSFTMGATDEQDSFAWDDEIPVHEVTLSTYYIGDTEVTQALWKVVMDKNPSKWKGNNLPVERVSWEDCQNFVRRLNKMTGKNFRLPTEAEWEFAARGGNKTTGCKYSGSNDIDKVAWYYGNSNDRTHDVKTKSPNELGIYDMSGNVLEWCQDWYGKYSSSSQTNPIGSSSGSLRVLRGGSWFDRNCWISRRSSVTSSNRSYYIGLRLAL